MRFLLLATVVSASSIVNRDRARMVEEINKMSGVTWQAGFNKFAPEPLGASASLCGVPPNFGAELENDVATGKIVRVDSDPNMVIPDNFDSETNWPLCAKIIDDIRDQSNCGCCWAFGPAEAASDRICIASNASVLITLSTQDLCFCSSRNGCGGGWPTSAYNYISQHGIVSGGQNNNTLGPLKDLCSQYSLPHCHHHGPIRDDPFPPEGTPGCPSMRSPQCPTKCDATAKAPHNNFETDRYKFVGQTETYHGEAAMQQAIMAGGPIAAAFSVYADFENYVSGIYHHVSGGAVGGHAIKVVGWGVENGNKYWKIANSWNPYWGEKGYFRMRRGNNECGIETGAVSSAANVKWQTPKGTF